MEWFVFRNNQTCSLASEKAHSGLYVICIALRHLLCFPTCVITFLPPPPSDAVSQITSFMGMQPCERSDRVEGSKSSHTLLLAGVFRGGHDVLVRARLAQSQGVTMKITVRSDDITVTEIIAGAVG